MFSRKGWSSRRSTSSSGPIPVGRNPGGAIVASSALTFSAQSRRGCSANTERSVARGAFGSPTFFVGNEIFFGKYRLRDVEEMILATR
jgi:2-hydroxychromene-2-carboxylate isomerase